MSMRDYAVDDYGLVLTENHLRILSEKLFDDFNEEDWKVNKYGYIEGIVDKLGVESISEFCGEAIAINNDGTDNWSNTEYYSEGCLYYVGISVYPNLFKRAYKGISGLVDEFKGKIGRYMPEDFNYRDHIRHIVGTYYG